MINSLSYLRELDPDNKSNEEIRNTYSSKVREKHFMRCLDSLVCDTPTFSSEAKYLAKDGILRYTEINNLNNQINGCYDHVNMDAYVNERYLLMKHSRGKLLDRMLLEMHNRDDYAIIGNAARGGIKTYWTGASCILDSLDSYFTKHICEYSRPDSVKHSPDPDKHIKLKSILGAAKFLSGEYLTERQDDPSGYSAAKKLYSSSDFGIGNVPKKIWTNRDIVDLLSRVSNHTWTNDKKMIVCTILSLTTCIYNWWNGEDQLVNSSSYTEALELRVALDIKTSDIENKVLPNITCADLMLADTCTENSYLHSNIDMKSQSDSYLVLLSWMLLEREYLRAVKRSSTNGEVSSEMSDDAPCEVY